MNVTDFRIGSTMIPYELNWYHVLPISVLMLKEGGALHLLLQRYSDLQG